MSRKPVRSLTAYAATEPVFGPALLPLKVFAIAAASRRKKAAFSGLCGVANLLRDVDYGIPHTLFVIAARSLKLSKELLYDREAAGAAIKKAPVLSLELLAAELHSGGRNPFVVLLGGPQRSIRNEGRDAARMAGARRIRAAAGTDF